VSRLIVNPFEEKRGTVIPRALDVTEIDAGFQRVAAALNGGLDETNLASGVKLAAGSAADPHVDNAFAEPCQYLTLQGFIEEGAAGGYAVLGSLPAGTWALVYATAILYKSTSLAGTTFTLVVGASTLLAAAPLTVLSATSDPAKSILRVGIDYAAIYRPASISPVGGITGAPIVYGSFNTSPDRPSSITAVFRGNHTA
jgi:hypothetical protein